MSEPTDDTEPVDVKPCDVCGRPASDGVFRIWTTGKHKAGKTGNYGHPECVSMLIRAIRPVHEPA